MKHSNSDVIFLHVYNNSPYQITLPLGLLGYCKTNATTSTTNEPNSQNQRLQSYHVSQPDIFEPYTRQQHMRQPRPNYEPQNNNFIRKIQQILTIINQLKCKMKYRFHITSSNTK